MDTLESFGAQDAAARLSRRLPQLFMNGERYAGALDPAAVTAALDDGRTSHRRKAGPTSQGARA